MVNLLTLGSNSRQRRLTKQVSAIEALQPTYSGLTLSEVGPAFVRADSTEDRVALIRQAVFLTQGFWLNPQQLFAGLALNEGVFAQMNTGEGKTVTALIPAALHVAQGDAVHVITANEYLASRDAELANTTLSALGMSVATTLPDMKEAEKREVYSADIQYGTASEFGFDYLKDNTRTDVEPAVPGYDFALIDEVDSILIDEARTPLILSANNDDAHSARVVRRYKKIVDTMTRDLHYTVDTKHLTCEITTEGSEYVQQKLGVDNFYTPALGTEVGALYNALKAQTLFTRDKDYIVTDDGVQIVDEFTGRILDGRRFSEGLHQALEAKENITITAENKTIASITLQAFFSRYKTLSGMTGTIGSSSQELWNTYEVPSIEVAPFKPVRRVDHEPLVFISQKEKIANTVTLTQNYVRRGRPVLIGTGSVAESERISRALNNARVEHTLLNASRLDDEAGIIAQAGRIGSVTVATNMAGRGTDIKLGGGDAVERSHVLHNGGLAVIGTSMSDSSRIDNQLSGRAGRQGDPGSSIFIVSMEDYLPQRFLSPKNLEELQKEYDEDPHQQLGKEWGKFIRESQSTVESFAADVRDGITKFDNIVSPIRENFLELRNNILIDPASALLSAHEFLDLEVPSGQELSRKANVLTSNRTQLLRQFDDELTTYITWTEQMRESVGFRTLAQEEPINEFRTEVFSASKKLLKTLSELLVDFAK